MERSNDSIGLVPAFTFVLWAGCVIVGVAGLLGSPVQSATPTTKPVDATPIEVSLVAAPTESTMLSPSLDATTPTLEAPPADDTPPAPAAVAPSPAIAFAVPINATPSLASTARPAPRSTPAVGRHATGGVRQLTFGTGEGRQPAPEYPIDAALAGHQGSVGVLFSVDASGRVTQTSVEIGSGWPALNEAALDAVRDTWRFTPGAMRTYRVTIQFRLNN